MKIRAQGSLEYLLVIGLVILVSAIVMTILPSSIKSPATQFGAVDSAYDSLRGGLSLSGIELVAVDGGESTNDIDILYLSNNSGRGLTLMKVASADGTIYYTSSGLTVGSGSKVSVVLGHAFACAGPDLIITYSSMVQTIRGSDLVCGNDYSLIAGVSGGGNGTSMSPFMINDCYQLQWVGLQNDLNYHYKLATNIDCSSVLEFSPIGSFSAPFIGGLDGDGKTVSNLVFRRSAEGAGLFGYAGAGSIVQNLTINNFSVVASLKSSPSDSRKIYFSGETDKCTGSLYAKLDAGVSRNNKVYSSSFTLTGYSGDSGVGGLVGCMYEGSSVINCSTSTNVNSVVDNAGGLVGKNIGGAIKDSNSSGSVSGPNVVGGLVGYQNGGSVLNSFSSGNVNSSMLRVGGLIGDVINATITDSHASGAVSGVTYVGGLVGSMSGTSVLRSYANNSVSGINELGGLVGNGANASSISSSYYSGTILANHTAGGLAGNFSGNITNSWADSNISFFGDCGTWRGLGQMECHINMGGLVGVIYTGSITNSYSLGDINGSVYIGGLVGVLGDAASVANSFSTVIGNEPNYSSCGGLVGEHYGNLITNSFFTDSAHNNYKGSLVPSGPTAFYGVSHSHSVYSTWNFANVWVSADNRYPLLAWQNN
ncbi:MAG: GLUG motif-containing protein [archaeon]